MTVIVSARRSITDAELDAIVSAARLFHEVNEETAVRLVGEIRRLRSDLLCTLVMTAQLMKDLRSTEDLAPPGAPRLADFES